VAYFLSHFGLLVVCRNNRLLDGVTSLSAPAKAASSLIRSVKVISGGTSVDTLPLEFPDLIPATDVKREMRYNTVHNVSATTERPPVACQPR
jgi:hypothetical protein